MRLFLVALTLSVSPSASAPDYATRVAPVFQKYCVGCHNAEDHEGKLSLETYSAFLKGTPRGPVFKAGDPNASRLIRQLIGLSKPIMPPEGEPKPTAEDIETLKTWIAAGAPGPVGLEPDRLALNVPKIATHARVRPITALDVTRGGTLMAVARYESVSLDRIDPGGAGPSDPVRVWNDFPGKVTAVHFSADGSRLVTASGVAGLGGLATVRDLKSGAIAQSFKGHLDLIYDAELSPDGKTLATCSYDRTVILWETSTGASLRTLSGHNGAVYDVAFSPDGSFLVTASADDTCKVWRVADGLRLDTLPQPLKEEYACAFSPDGRFIAAGGADNTIRVWEFLSREKAQTNPMIQARFAHEGPIVKLAYAADGSRLVTASDDRTVKVWETKGYTELAAFGPQPDVISALALSGDGRSIRIGRMDGSIGVYAITDQRSVDSSLKSLVIASTPSAKDAPLALNATAELEPNNVATQATPIRLPARVSGTIGASGDVDLFRFSAKAGVPLIIDVDASRSNSKLDSFIEVLDANGQRVERVLLQAVRDSYFTFRGKDDSNVDDFRLFNWEEMRLNEYVYSNGEISRLWLYPRGPDSGFQVYPGQGKRWGFFDSTPLAHALGEPCYVVQPLAAGVKPVPNGLPVFPVYFENDDDSLRELGKDSRLGFSAPVEGDYLIRLKDVRGLGGPDFTYAMSVRPARPDFQVTLQDPKTPIGPGDSREFKVIARRIDGFDGPIQVEVSGLPAGLSATTPVVIEAGQIQALGVISALTGARPSAVAEARVKASAQIGGREVSHEVGAFKIAVGDTKPKLMARIGPADGGPKPIETTSEGIPIYEIKAGETITLKVKVERDGFKGGVPFGNEGSGRNLPFGVIVDNIGLNGLLVLEDQDDRVFFLTADRSVPPQTRAFHLLTAADGGHATPPVILRVK